jgi:hypothetical protein
VAADVEADAGGGAAEAAVGGRKQGEDFSFTAAERLGDLGCAPRSAHSQVSVVVAADDDAGGTGLVDELGD